MNPASDNSFNKGAISSILFLVINNKVSTLISLLVSCFLLTSLIMFKRRQEGSEITKLSIDKLD